MRKFFGIAAFVAAFVCVGCDGLSSLKSEDFVRESSVQLVEGHDYHELFKVSLEYGVRGTSPEALREINNAIALNALGIESDNFDKAFEEFIDIKRKEYVSENMDLFREATKSVSDSEEEKNAFIATFNWELFLQGSFSKAYKGVISYVLDTYSYMGGAHGISNISVMNFNVKTGKEIEEKDFFVENYREELSRLLTENLYSAINDGTMYESLFVKDIEPNGNFEVTEAGVTYIYNEYEIGPYSMGAIRVTIPWSSLKNLVR